MARESECDKDRKETDAKPEQPAERPTETKATAENVVLSRSIKKTLRIIQEPISTWASIDPTSPGILSPSLVVTLNLTDNNGVQELRCACPQTEQGLITVLWTLTLPVSDYSRTGLPGIFVASISLWDKHGQKKLDLCEALSESRKTFKSTGGSYGGGGEGSSSARSAINIPRRSPYIPIEGPRRSSLPNPPFTNSSSPAQYVEASESTLISLVGTTPPPASIRRDLQLSASSPPRPPSIIASSPSPKSYSSSSYPSRTTPSPTPSSPTSVYALGPYQEHHRQHKTAQAEVQQHLVMRQQMHEKTQQWQMKQYKNDDKKQNESEMGKDEDEHKLLKGDCVRSLVYIDSEFTDENVSEGLYFIFHEIAICQPGEYKLEVQLWELGGDNPNDTGMMLTSVMTSTPLCVNAKEVSRRRHSNASSSSPSAQQKPPSPASPSTPLVECFHYSDIDSSLIKLGLLPPYPSKFPPIERSPGKV